MQQRRSRRSRRSEGIRKIITAPFVRRNIPFVDFLHEEALLKIEDQAEWLMQEIGLEFTDDPVALEIWREAGADVNMGEQGDGATPLHLAARYNHAPVQLHNYELRTHIVAEPVLLRFLNASTAPRVGDIVGGVEAAGIWGACKYGIDLA